MFLEILTIIIATIIVLGGFLIVVSKDDGPLMINGSTLVSFGITALFWFAKVTTPHLREESAIKWLYRPISDLPEWIGYVGLATTATLLAITLVFLVDDIVYLTQHRKGGRH